MVSAYVRGGPGSDVAKKFAVRGFPSIIFVDAQGAMLCQSFGGFNHPDDALSLDRFVQKVAADPQLRGSLGQRKACGRADP